MNFDYAPPQGGETANLTIKSTLDGYNQRVIFHGENPCDPRQATLVGLINAGAIGQENVKQLHIIVPAGVDVRLSLPQQDVTAVAVGSATLRYCQPVVKFVPEAGRSYTLEFSSCSAAVYAASGISDNGNGAQIRSELDRSCAVTAKNMGTDSKVFFLMEKDSSTKAGSN
jgi:hypothetical protein